MKSAAQTKRALRRDAQRVWEMEKELSTHALDRQDYGNVDKTYNVYTMDELKSLYPTLDLDDI